MKYRKKPVVVEAVQWTGLNLEEIKEFVGRALTYIINDTAWKAGKGRPCVYIKIRTLEGEMEVSEKDFIIKGVNGEFYPCKPDIFQKTYAPEDERQTAYDPDKVVEQLENYCFEKYCAEGDSEIGRIVKGGGADQELECKWKLEEEGNLYVTECENRHIVFDGTPEENGYRYCPYCGRKIKEVD